MDCNNCKESFRNLFKKLFSDEHKISIKNCDYEKNETAKY